MHGCTGQLSLHTHTHTHIFTHSHTLAALQPPPPCNALLLLRLAEVVAEVVVARWFGDDRRAVRDGDILQVQEAELDLHGEEDLQLAAHGFTAHLPAQKDAQSVGPQAELTQRKGCLVSFCCALLAGNEMLTRTRKGKKVFPPTKNKHWMGD